MNISKFYSKSVSKVFKKNHDKELESFKWEFLPIFVNSCKILPENVATEIFSRFVTYSDREYKDSLYNLVNLFELFEENYIIEEDPFNDDEWEYLKNVVNDCTEELGIDLIKYIMQLLLDLNRI